MNRDDMRLSIYSLSLPDKTVDQVIEATQQCGCAGIEWWCKEKGHVDAAHVEASAAELANKMQNSSLTVAGLAPYFTYSETKEQLKPVFHAAAILGAKQIRCHSYLFNGETPYRELFAAQRRWLEERVLPVAEEFDVRLAIEQHHYQICCTPHACRAMCEGLPARYVGIIYDPGNSLMEGYTRPAYAISVMGEYLAHVHVKACKPLVAAASGVVPTGRVYPYEWGSLAAGDLDWRMIIGELRKAGYRGYLSLEDLDQRASDQKITEDIPFIQRILSEI